MKANKFRITILLSVNLLLFAMNCRGEEFWAEVIARGKGDDYLLVFEPEPASGNKVRQLRCYKSLPIYIEQIAQAAEAVKSRPLIRFSGEIIEPQVGGRYVKNVSIKMIIVGNREMYRQILRTSGLERLYLPPQVESAESTKRSADRDGKKAVNMSESKQE